MSLYRRYTHTGQHRGEQRARAGLLAGSIALAAIVALTFAAIGLTSHSATADSLDLTYQQCQQALGFPARSDAEKQWLQTCVSALTPPTSGPTASPTDTPTASPTSESPSAQPSSSGPSGGPTASTSPSPTGTPTTPPPTATPTATPTPSPTSTFVWPNAANTGPDRPCDQLTRVNGDVTITSSGLYSNKDVHGTITVRADNVQIANVCVRPGSHRDFGIYVPYFKGAQIVNVEIDGNNIVDQGIETPDATSAIVTQSDISGVADGIAGGVGIFTKNFIHDPTTNASAHVDMIQNTGWRCPGDPNGDPWPTNATLLVQDNTLLNPLRQTGVVSLFQDQHCQARNSTINHNWLAGGGYTIYGGAGQWGNGVNIVITNNVFARTYYPQCGANGPVTAFSSAGSGNRWSGNVYDNGATVTP